MTSLKYSPKSRFRRSRVIEDIVDEMVWFHISNICSTNTRTSNLICTNFCSQVWIACIIGIALDKTPCTSTKYLENYPSTLTMVYPNSSFCPYNLLLYAAICYNCGSTSCKNCVWKLLLTEFSKYYTSNMI